MGSKSNTETVAEDLAPDQYEVEKILKKRTRNGKTEYLIKWLGYPTSSNSWEPSENLNASSLASFKDTKKRKRNDESESSDDSESDVIESDNCGVVEIDRGGWNRFQFEDGFTPEKILEAKSRNGELVFLFKYENSNEGEYVPAKIANVKFPQLVIEFYESIILWADELHDTD